ncbi:IS66 family insertion sequence element accessory protein TnpB [Halomonas tibetensis]|uniref:IS66 family insertion sequence element accessory protein TnpB n=1 Tax=Halomonas tibetensis TaxID=2259590 RepID=A0ABV7BA29_9GAMM
MRPPVQLWLCTQPNDMRRSYDGLAAMVRRQLGQDPLSGHGFLFINRRRKRNLLAVGLNALVMCQFHSTGPGFLAFLIRCFTSSSDLVLLP